MLAEQNQLTTGYKEKNLL